jgi:hypothetical protein
MDIEIACNRRTTIVIKAINENLQLSKNNLTPSLSEMIKQKTRENSWLREEPAHLWRKQRPNMFLLDKVTFVIKELEQVVIEYYRLDTIIEQDRR